MKYLLSILSLIFLISCQKEEKKNSSLSRFVPKDAIATFKIDNPDSFLSNLNNNELTITNADLDVFAEAKIALEYLDNLENKSPLLLSFIETGNNRPSYTIVTQSISSNYSKDSISKHDETTILYDSKKLEKVTLKNKHIYKTTLDSILFISNSQILIENTIRDFDFYNDYNKTEITKLLDVSQSDASLIINTKDASKVFGNHFQVSDNLGLSDFANLLALDLDVSQNAIKADGITQINDSIPKLINLFKNTIPKENKIAQYVPLTAKGFISYTYESYSELRNNLKTFHFKNKELLPLEDEALFNSVNEIGLIYNDNDKIVFLNSIDTDITNETLISQNTVAETFRDVDIFNFETANVFYEAYHPLVNSQNFKYYIYIGQGFLFAEDIESLKNCIANIQNKTVLAQQDFYEDMMSSLSDESSILYVVNTDALKLNNIKFKDHKLAALQFIIERDFAHVHTTIEKAGAKSTSKGIAQMGSIKLDNPIVGEPQFFKNHINGSKDILVQDNTNQLYLISNGGNIRWKKQFDSPILGKIEEVDVYKNGRIQLAFNTQNKFYIIDRNGKNIEGFPISIPETITQPLAVFDYDNNRNYRFIVTTGNQVKMYNKEGKTVTGFKFSKADDQITSTPKHIRIGSRDYILVMAKSGKLHILSRTGSDRITINKNLDLSENDWYKYNNTFASTNENGELMQIDEKGKLSITKLGLPQDHNIVSTSKTLVTLAENKLTIKGKTIELDFGLYSKPSIFYINNKIYVSVTDTQAHKVYLFDSNGILRPNFPVYGNSVIDLENIDKDKNLEFIVQGEEDSILIYKIN